MLVSQPPFFSFVEILCVPACLVGISQILHNMGKPLQQQVSPTKTRRLSGGFSTPSTNLHVSWFGGANGQGGLMGSSDSWYWKYFRTFFPQQLADV